MEKLFDQLKKLTLTELFLLGTAIILLILVATKWQWVVSEVSDSIKRMLKLD